MHRAVAQFPKAPDDHHKGKWKKMYTTERDAALAFDKYIRSHHLSAKVNFPNTPEAIAYVPPPNVYASRYTGVQKRGKKWRGRAYRGERGKDTKVFKTELEAAVALRSMRADLGLPAVPMLR